MTGSWVVDIIVVVLALTAAISGFRHGAVASAVGLVGVFLGVAAGILLVPYVIDRIDDTTDKRITGIGLLIALVSAGLIAGMVLGAVARAKVSASPVRIVDSVVGAFLQGMAVLVAALLVAIPISSSTEPQLAAAVRDSRILSGLNDIAPQWLKDLPDSVSDELREKGIPQVVNSFGKAPIAPVSPPDTGLSNDPAVRQARGSVVMVLGTAHQCSRALEGSGFVIAPHRVVTNAHVVAGTDQVNVRVRGQGDLNATVVLYDPEIDIAVLDVPDLRKPALRLQYDPAPDGSDAIALGYPEGGPFTASPQRIRARVELAAPDIYGARDVHREVYTTRGSIRQGNSGGPLINRDGEVVGVIFGAAVEHPDTGFALTTAEIRQLLGQSQRDNGQVSTGQCVTE